MKIQKLCLVCSMLMFLLMPMAVHAAQEAVENGKTVSIDYTLTVDGKVLDTSTGKQPLKYVQGQGSIIPGLERKLAGMHVGEEKNVVVKPEEGYGLPNPQAIQEVDRKLIPADISLAVGTTLQMHDEKGNTFPAEVKSIEKDKVTLDFNHPLAGKVLNFKVKVVAVN